MTLEEQWAEFGFAPLEFWEHTPCTYAAAIRGAIDRRRADYDMALYGAWNAERFHREELLRPYSHYAKQAGKASGQQKRMQTAQERLAVFTAMAGGGVGLTITPLD